MSAAPATRAIAVCRRGRNTIWVAAVLFAAVLLAPTGRAEAANARVQYVSATTVYLDAGRAAGLAEGMTVTVVRDGRDIAQLVVDYVAMNSAACRADSTATAVRAGDLCRFTPAAPADSAVEVKSGAAAGGTAAETPSGGGESASWMGLGRVRGQVVSTYLRSTDTGGGLATPSLSANFYWTGRAQERLFARFRGSRPTYDARTDLAGLAVHEENIRLYEAQVGYRSRTGVFEAEGGRLAPRRLEYLGALDGAAARMRVASGVTVGAAGGQAAPLGVSGFGSTGVRAGAFVEASARPSGGRLPWRALLGAAFLGDSAVTRRQYLVEQVQVSPRSTWSVQQSAEIDWSPSWKQDLGEDPVVLTAWAIVATARLGTRGSITAGVDSRRGVLLPEQRAFPTAVALDRFEGAQASGGLDLGRGNSVRIAGGYRRRVGGGATYEYVGGGWNNNWLARQRVDAGANANVYRSDLGEGLNADAHVGARWSSWSRFELSGGWNGARSLATGLAPPPTASWIRAGLDYHAPNGAWAALAHEWRGGSGRELAAELGVSF